MNFLAEGDEGDGQGEDWGGARAPVGGGRGADLTGSAFGLPAQWPAANNKKLTHKYPHMCTGMYPNFLSTG